ncbi:hypothetical protein METBIDRAFT_33667 [Metschnikowia bicuspidata var. bicuspidata NRRL YB-4993]|uniref:GRF-type domain-containing protein n=1 Tax=Metschnikowia bicuspidata var. bicuspidata NRRL YB-4993 TaxID=869754 RepID=A0A1A0H4P6_9ASCO|nr:hypothetical protein METBIDRAFT_33667 [Metschnikowia bicuspidata var. bicuspidata NRRL YB-4993]OBA19049.1 hypothetical protein METBIDRAFT_33667 [Metschnikowia bicuspidata var. bicuspidata NRRL YB-4993]
MDDLFEDKLLLLRLYYPAVAQEILKDFLTNCDGDLDATRSLIDGKPRPKKRQSSAQAALTKFTQKRPKPNSKNVFESDATSHSPKTAPAAHSGDRQNVRNVLPIITLNTPLDVDEHLSPYASLHLNFLPESISNRLVHDLVEKQEAFRSNKFHLFGNQCELNSSTGVFARPAAPYSQLVFNGLKMPKPFPYSKSMEEVSECVETFLNEKVIPQSQRLKWQLNEPWTNDFSVVNCYEKLQNNMDWHSDRLSHIGPHNYVASISLGTTRMFRLRNTYKERAPIYQIPLPHNSLFIMRPGCQEEFKHCVSPMLKAIDVHPVLGTTRFGITARCYTTFLIENLPRCKCDTKMVLRRSHKSLVNRGKYFWLCENVYQNKGCNSFYWCDFTNVEGNYTAKDDSNISIWIAPEDTDKLNYDKNFSINTET